MWRAIFWWYLFWWRNSESSTETGCTRKSPGSSTPWSAGRRRWRRCSPSECSGLRRVPGSQDIPEHQKTWSNTTDMLWSLHYRQLVAGAADHVSFLQIDFVWDTAGKSWRDLALIYRGLQPAAADWTLQTLPEHTITHNLNRDGFKYRLYMRFL